jgi:hypothetical protein
MVIKIIEQSLIEFGVLHYDCSLDLHRENQGALTLLELPHEERRKAVKD